ncbi:SRPBCC family protein [Arachnia propionica]|nr:SRPBCC family protein [Arachnia propionica]
MMMLSSFRATSPLPPRTIFDCWARPQSWPVWDPEVSEVDFRGPAVVGAVGKLKPRSGPSATFTITVLEQERRLVNETSLPGARLVFLHQVEPGHDGSRVVVEVSVVGALGWLWGRLLRRSFANSAQASGEGLLRHLEGEPA